MKRWGEERIKKKEISANTEIHEYNKKKKIHYTSGHRRPPTMKIENEQKDEIRTKENDKSAEQQNKRVRHARWAFSIIKIFLLTKTK